MTPDPTRDEHPEESPDDAHGESVDDAWARIVAGYEREPDPARHPWPESEDATTDDEDGADQAAPPSEQPVRAPPAAPDDEDHYVPPHPPPLPRPTGLVGAAWVGLLGGPLLLLVATVLGWRLPTLLTGAAVLGFVGGLVFLIARMDNRGPGGWDNGAQV